MIETQKQYLKRAKQVEKEFWEDMTKLQKKCEKKINAWDMWSRNFYNAKRFFESKGNMETKSKLKDRWYRQFEKDLRKLLTQ